MLFKKKEAPQTTMTKQEQQALTTIQNLIPLHDLENGMLITPDLQMVQCLKVSAINLELTSNLELNDLFETFEGYLITLTYPVQFTNVSMPVDLSQYIAKKERIYERTTNPHKRRLLKSYIKHLKEYEISQEIMQRQRFIIFSEQITEDTAEGRQDVFLALKERREEVISNMVQLGLEAEPVTNLDIVRYLHTLFDYNGAQVRPIDSLEVAQIIEGGRAHEKKQIEKANS